MPAQQSALKVWQLRQYEDYDPDVELGTRNMQMALRRLRKFARTAVDLELDLNDNHPLDREQWGLSANQGGARAPQRGQSITVARRRRLHG